MPSVDPHVLSVLSYEKRPGCCPVCREKALLFVCHGFGLFGRHNWSRREEIQERCKACAIREASGEERIWVKTTFFGLRDVWKHNRRLQLSEAKQESLAKARAARAA